MQACKHSFSRRAFGLQLSSGLAAGLGLVAWGEATAAAVPATVRVRNSQLKVLRELQTNYELNQFHRFWESRQTTEQTTKTLHDWSFTLDVVTNGRAQRWMYQTNGTLALVALNTQPVYQIANPSLFNALIGAPKY
jgi:hypothetical protein